MNAVSSRLRQRGFSVSEFVEDDPSLPAALENSGACISMARSPQALRQLEVLESSGMTVLNTPASVRLCCHRSLLLASLQKAGVPLASADWSDGGFWVKRGDASAQSAADVQFAADSVEVERLTAALHQRGISDVVVTYRATSSSSTGWKAQVSSVPAIRVTTATRSLATSKSMVGRAIMTMTQPCWSGRPGVLPKWQEFRFLAAMPSFGRTVPSV